MRISFLGGVRTVTGSMHVVEANNKRILLDCGLFQGRRKEAQQKNRHLPFEEQMIDAMILSHAHIDHSGNIPNLVKNGYVGPIYATHATVDLCRSMLADSGYIQEKDAEYVNKKRAKRGQPPVEPIYTQKDALAAMDSFVGQPYGKSFSVADGVQATFYDAGHVLGSALTKLTISENGRTLSLGYIVDLGRSNLPILRDPVIIEDLDFIIIESTYGGRLHDSIDVAEEQLYQVVHRTVARGGKIIIPSFALERTQEIVYSLNNLWNAKKLPRIQVFVDSPLAVNITEVFKAHPECFDKETLAVYKYDDDPFGFDKLSYVRDVQKSKEINSLRDSCIIISASGMCEAGRVLHHLKNNVGKSQNTVLIVGFMASNTLGRKLLEKWPRVKIFGEEYNVRAEIVVIDAFSAHADRDGLIGYVRGAQKNVRGVFLVHGEESQGYALAEGLKEAGIDKVKVPHPGESVDL